MAPPSGWAQGGGQLAMAELVAAPPLFGAGWAAPPQGGGQAIIARPVAAASYGWQGGGQGAGRPPAVAYIGQGRAQAGAVWPAEPVAAEHGGGQATMPGGTVAGPGGTGVGGNAFAIGGWGAGAGIGAAAEIGAGAAPADGDADAGETEDVADGAAPREVDADAGGTGRAQVGGQAHGVGPAGSGQAMTAGAEATLAGWPVASADAAVVVVEDDVVGGTAGAVDTVSAGPD